MTNWNADSKIRTAVDARIDQLMDQASNLGWSLTRPTIDYGLRGAVGGKMSHRGVMYVNVCILRENWDHYLLQTIGHEFAHHVAHAIHPGCTAHGYEWKAIMRRLGLPADRTHNYNVDNAQIKKKNKFRYLCGCGKDVFMGPVRHKNHRQGYIVRKGVKRPYKLMHCRKHELTFVENMGKVTYDQARAAAEKPAPKPKAKPASGPKRPWKEVAIEVYQRAPTRGTFIATMENLGMKKVTASTYHHNIKSGKWG